MMKSHWFFQDSPLELRLSSMGTHLKGPSDPPSTGGQAPSAPPPEVWLRCHSEVPADTKEKSVFWSGLRRDSAVMGGSLLVTEEIKEVFRGQHCW